MSFGKPQRIGDVLAELMARRGYAREQSFERYAEVWRQVAGEMLAASSRATQVRRGVLEVLVSNSTMIQEIAFQKSELVKRLAAALPEENIRDLRLRVGPVP
jgi:predicted nucleic acid-binding Zn ribbon protein